MITRIEIDGFKSFHNFAVDLQPFTALIGGNGTGKSNLFDALAFLSYLADGLRVAEALNKIRGGAREAFALHADGTRADTMKFAVELIIDTNSKIMRYEIHFIRLKQGGFQVIHESLTRSDSPLFVAAVGKVRGDFPRMERKRTMKIVFVQDANVMMTGGRDLSKAALSLHMAGAAEENHIVRSELQTWRTLHLDPSYLREPSKASEVYEDTTVEPNGANLPAMLQRMSVQDEDDISNLRVDMVNAVPGFQDFEIRKLEAEDKLALRVKMVDGNEYWADSVSDGTLRLLAFAALRHDPQLQGVLCVEEPENGVSPFQLRHLIKLLQSTATDLSDATQLERPLRQVILSTHSLEVMNLVPDDSLRLVYMPASLPRRTRMTPLKPELVEDDQLRIFTKAQARKYLRNEQLSEAVP